MIKNYNFIKDITVIYDLKGKPCKWKVNTIKAIDEHFNIPHVGCSILSMSKRIMNEVICLAEDNKLDIYYQDTDSMHIQEKDIETLQNAFKTKYDKELIGKNMGQFHSDFDFKKHTDVYASKSIFLGKKSYIDELKGTDEKGNINTSYHIRMKGIPNKVILYTVEKMKLSSPMELYEKLYNKEAILFDLTCGGDKANFKKHANYTIETLKMFNRIIIFDDDEVSKKEKIRILKEENNILETI